MDDDEGTHELVMPFVTVASCGGPHDDTSYSAGWQMCELDSELRTTSPVMIQRTIFVSSAAQADLIAMHYGYRCTVTQYDDVWCWVLVERADM